MQILTEMLFTLDYAQLSERRMYRYVEDNNPEYRETQSDVYLNASYGTMLLDFAEADIRAFEHISLPAAALLSSMNVQAMQTEQDKITELAKRTQPLLRALPDLFSIYREKGIRAIDALLQQKEWNHAEKQERILNGFKDIFLNAHVISTYIEQVNTLLHANVFADEIYGQKATAEIRMDMIYHLLGARDEKVNDYFYTPQVKSGNAIEGISVPLLPDLMAPSDYSFLHDAEIRQKMILTEADNDLHQMEYYIHADDTMQSVIVGYIQDMIDNDAVIRKCRHCGRYFVAQSKTVYCERTVDAQGKTCRKKGAMAYYTQNLDNVPEKKAYRQMYKSNFAKMKNGVLSRDDFEKWKKEANKLKKDVEDGVMELEVFLDWLKYGE